MMKCESFIEVQAGEDTNKLLHLFVVEDKELSNKRARFSMSQENNSVKFSILADDAVALRAMLGSITKTLSIFEKAKQTIEEVNKK